MRELEDGNYYTCHCKVDAEKGEEIGGGGGEKGRNIVGNQYRCYPRPFAENRWKGEG